MEAGIMEELKVCREERDLLKQKLDIHLDRWTLDKIMFEEMAAKAARELRLTKAELVFEMARKDMRIGSQQQELLILKLKLDSALEDMELKQTQFSALKSQLQEERKWEHLVTGKLKEMKVGFAKKAQRKVHRLQKLLDDWVSSHIAKVSTIEGKHAQAVSQLKREIKQMVSRDEDMKLQQIQWNIERTQLQAVARERDELRTEQRQWQRDREEMCAVLQERERLRVEVERCKLQQDEIQRVKEELGELLEERDKLRDRRHAQLEHVRSRGADIQELTKERDKLKQQLDLSNIHRQEEVKALVRERDFVWSQMKNLDEDFEKRIKKLSEQKLQDRQEIERLSCALKGAQVSYSELMVETTILKLEVKREGDLAIQKQRASEAELLELQMRMEKVKEEKQTLLAEAEQRESQRTQLASLGKEALIKIDFPYRDQGAGAVADGAKAGLEILNSGDSLVLDQDILESQIDQVTQVQRNDELKSAKPVEDLMRENENLRRETENLRILYAELEGSLREKNQKPAKVAQKGNHRDPTSRNLKLELEAAATSCPSDESPIAEGNFLQNKREPSKRKASLRETLPQKRSGGACSKSGREDSHSSAHAENSEKNQSSKTIFVPSPIKLRRRSQVDYSDSKSSALDISLGESEGKYFKRRKKKVTGDVEPTQSQRPPLYTLSHNVSGTKSVVRTSSSSKGPLPQSEKKALAGSPTKTSKMMSNLFSTAFSVPKLKHTQTPSHLMT